MKAAIKFVLALAFALTLLVVLDNATMAGNSSSLKVGQPMIVDNRMPQDEKHEKPIFTKRIVAPNVADSSSGTEIHAKDSADSADAQEGEGEDDETSDDAALNVGQLDPVADTEEGNDNDD